MDLIVKTLKSGRKVGLAAMTSRMEIMAAQKAGDASRLDGQLRFLNEQVKMSVREIDGQPATYDALADLDAVFSYSEIIELRRLIGEINFGEGEPVPLGEGA